MPASVPASQMPQGGKEGFSTDTFNSPVKSIRGFTCAQVFLGLDSSYTIIIPLKSKAYAYKALQDYIHSTGAPLFLMAELQRKKIWGMDRYMPEVFHSSTDF
jgi:hypothetical protein